MGKNQKKNGRKHIVPSNTSSVNMTNNPVSVMSESGNRFN
jgi:hypothetical protein